MDRRRFLRALMGSGVLAAPLAAAAQQPGRVYRVGILASYPVEASPPIAAPLRDLGYVEGRNILFEIRSANDLPERLPALAAELVRLKGDVIVTGGDREVAVAKQATTAIPIVMAPSGDPVGAGFVASLARPGGNITGVSFMSPDLSAKQLEVLRDAVPNLSRIAVLWNASNPVKVIDFDQTRRAALALRLKVSSIEVRALGDLETAFAAITRVSPDALLILIDQVLSHVSRPRIAQFAIQRRIPSKRAIRITPPREGSLGTDRPPSSSTKSSPLRSLVSWRGPIRQSFRSPNRAGSSCRSTSRPPRRSA